MRSTRAIVAVTLALAAGVTSVASAAQSPQAQTEQQPRWDNRLQQQLGLSDQQAQAIREIYQRDADTKRQHWQQLRQAQASADAWCRRPADRSHGSPAPAGR